MSYLSGSSRNYTFLGIDFRFWISIFWFDNTSVNYFWRLKIFKYAKGVFQRVMLAVLNTSKIRGNMEYLGVN